MYRLVWWIDGSFIPAVSMLRDFVTTKVFPAFDGLDEQVERVYSETLQRMLATAGPDADHADLAEAAEDARITHYQRLSESHQGILNLMPVAIYHQFEQQQITLVRRELLFDGSEDDPSKMKTGTFVRLIQEAGIDPTAFAQFQKLTELRLVSNVVKHAEGWSAEELERVRPDLFVTPSIPGKSHELPQARRVYQPLSASGSNFLERCALPNSASARSLIAAEIGVRREIKASGPRFG